MVTRENVIVLRTYILEYRGIIPAPQMLQSKGWQSKGGKMLTAGESE